MAGLRYSSEQQQASPRVVPAQKAKGGISLGHVRYVLGTSLVLAVVAGAILWLVYFA